jgi:hypothetical protein
MKVLTISALLIILSCSLVSGSNLRVPFPLTPKAADLTDHFGTEPVQNVYGPKDYRVVHLAREGVTGEGTPITAITNFGKEINPVQVVSGDLENTSYDASKIIKPEIAGKIIKFIAHFSS